MGFFIILKSKNRIYTKKLKIILVIILNNIYIIYATFKKDGINIEQKTII